MGEIRRAWRRLEPMAQEAGAMVLPLHGSLTAAEQEEIRNYERVGNLLGLLKSKARQRLKSAAGSNGSGR